MPRVPRSLREHRAVVYNEHGGCKDRFIHHRGGCARARRAGGGVSGDTRAHSPGVLLREFALPLHVEHQVTAVHVLNHEEEPSKRTAPH